MYKGTQIGLSADISADTLQARKEWHEIFNVMKKKNLQHTPIKFEKSKVLPTSKS